MKKTLGILMALLLLLPNITCGQEDNWSKAVKKEYKYDDDKKAFLNYKMLSRVEE